MKAILLAAGKGQRLGELTSRNPKPMIEINGKPILEHNIEMCRKAGINDIYINLHHLPDIIRNYFGDGSKYGVHITYSYEEDLLGTAGALIPLKNKLENEPFFVIYGDNYIPFDLNELIFFNEGKKADISILFHWRENVGNSGIAEFTNKDRIIKFIEKPLNLNNNNWVNAGIYYVERMNFFDLIGINDDFGIDIFPKLLKLEYNLYGLKTKAQLVAIDTPELFRRNSKLPKIN